MILKRLLQASGRNPLFAFNTSSLWSLHRHVLIRGFSSGENKDVASWDVDKVIEWAKKQRNIQESDLKLLRENRVDGLTLLSLTEVKLIQDGFKRGTASSLEQAINLLKAPPEISAQTDPERIAYITSPSLDKIILPPNPARYYNYGGPVDFRLHYCIPGFLRCDELAQKEIMGLIDQGKYFVLHEQRQSGKTSYMLELRDFLNSSGKYAALYINVEAGQIAWSNVDRGVDIVLDELQLSYKRTFGINFQLRDLLKEHTSGKALEVALDLLSQHAAKQQLKFVLLLDEIDALCGDTLLSTLRQLRSGYERRLSGTFPYSIMLVGLRDVRDYKIYSKEQQEYVMGGSAFNISAVSARLPRFTEAQAKALANLHTADTGQAFDDNAIKLLMRLTDGQPWCVNRILYEATKTAPDTKTSISTQIIAQSAQQVVLSRETHLQNIAEAVRDPRVHTVIEAMLVGGHIKVDADAEYVEDLGLIKRDDDGKFVISTELYQEVVPRVLTNKEYLTTVLSKISPPAYLDERGRIKMKVMMDKWKSFFLENIESWSEISDFKEAGVHLLLFAFLQRVVNGGGKLHREYALGRKECDILIEKPYYGGDFASGPVQEEVIELKVWREKDTTPWKRFVEEAVDQVAKSYMARKQLTEGYLVIVDQKSKDPLPGRMREMEQVVETPKGKGTVYIYIM